MYLAETLTKGKPCYMLRQSYRSGNIYAHRDLFDLGSNPGRYIVYPGGNSFYIHEAIEETLECLDIKVDRYLLEDLFWPFVKPDIRRSVETFRYRRPSGSTRKNLSPQEEETIRLSLTPFDKRRLHYLKFARMDQGAVENMPPALFRELIYKSRDEMEQYFIREEKLLKTREYKSYVYVIFNLQGFFQSFMAKRMPQAMDQEKVEAYFIQEICKINGTLFRNKADQAGKPALHPYLVRYVVMFFDNDYQGSTLLDDFVNDFIYRHRFFEQTKPVAALNMDAICDILEIDPKTLKSMNKSSLTAHYRKLAQKHHPDKGGSNEDFVELISAYESALAKLDH